jgi:hypothetical protein
LKFLAMTEVGMSGLQRAERMGEDDPRESEVEKAMSEDKGE